MKKLNYSVIKNYFFLAGIAIIIIFWLINNALFDNPDAVLFCSGISLVACLCAFYRFNLGVIALFLGTFGKPSSRNKKFVDYEKMIIPNAEKIKQSIDYGKSSILLYKVNTREIYQIVKLDGRLLLNKCTIDKGLITDFTNLSEIKTGRGRSFIDCKTIKGVNFICSKTNYYLPTINIITQKKQYRFIGMFEALTTECIKNFFDDIPDVKVNIKSTPNSQKILNERLDNDKRDLNFNLLRLAAILFTPYCINIHTSGSGFKHGVAMFYIVVSVSLLIVFLFLSILNSKHYTIGFIYDEIGDYSRHKPVNKKLRQADKKLNKKDTTVEVFLISLTIIGVGTREETYVNLSWYIILVSAFTVVFLILFLKSNLIMPDSFKGRVIMIALSCFVFILSGCVVVSAVNNLVIFDRSQSSYNIIEKTSAHLKNDEIYYAKIRYNGKEHSVCIPYEEYTSNNNILDVEEVKGLLGIKYITYY